mgnify:CR=1 FL=1
MRLILLGPTAVGKTKLSIKVAKHLNSPIISADSRQCYKYLNIGTSKPTARELCRIPHYNISCLDLTEKESAQSFLNRVNNWEVELQQDHDFLLYCGGSTLHIRVLIQPFDDLPAADDRNVKKLQQEYEQKGIGYLYNKLEEVDPEYAQKMDGKNRQRIIRALDVWMQTAQPFSSFHNTSSKDIWPGKDTVVAGLYRDRQKLYERIDRRVYKMIEMGLIREVESIADLGYGKDLHSLKTVGYQEVFEYLDGEITKDEMIRQIQTKTRRYAKRQITWFKRWDFVNWLNMDEMSENRALTKIVNMLEGDRNNS